MKKIVVIGSLNMDVVIETPYMPKCGETIAGKNVNLVPGGKVRTKHMQLENLVEMLR